MPLIKCPRCELNYMEVTEKYCKVCRREMHGSGAREEPEICSACSESPALPGKDVCIFCLKEMQEAGEEGEDIQPLDVTSDSVSTMDEMTPVAKEEHPDSDYEEMSGDLSLEEIEEKEAQESDEEEEDV